MFVFLIFALVLAAVPEFGFTDEKLCNPGGLSLRFSGLRVYSSVVYGLPFRHYWSVVNCNNGVVDSMQYFPCNRSSNFQFGEPVELDGGDVFVFSRKKSYALRNVPIYRPFTYIGGVYKMDVENNVTQLLAPLQADTTSSKFVHENVGGQKMTYVPFLYASVDKSRTRGWDAGMELSPFEFYSYTAEDKKTRWFRINKFLNDVERYTYINDRFIPWEFDAVDNQLEGVDWRRVVNAAL